MRPVINEYLASSKSYGTFVDTLLSDKTISLFEKNRVDSSFFLCEVTLNKDIRMELSTVVDDIGNSLGGVQLHENRTWTLVRAPILSKTYTVPNCRRR